jgi:hypothetical protein
LVFFEDNKRNDYRHIMCARVVDYKIILDEEDEFLMPAQPTHLSYIEGVPVIRDDEFK